MNFDIILKSLDIILEENLWPDKKPSECLRILMYVHNKGFLYTPKIDGEISAILCAYKIKDITNVSLTKLPEEDGGKILYVPFVVSLKKDINVFHIIRESCKMYLESNPEIEEIVLEDKNNKIKKYKLKTLQGV